MYTADITYEWNKQFKVAYSCGDNSGTSGAFVAGTCPTAISGGYLIGDGAAGTFTTRKTVTAAGQDKYHGLATNAATTRLAFNGSFSGTSSTGWIARTATADSVYGVHTSAVTPGAASGAVVITIQLVQAVIEMAPARVNNGSGAYFHPNVTITKAGDAACVVTLDAVTSGAAASANRLYNPTCGAGTYYVTYNSTVIGGNTISWITGAGARIQSAVVTGIAQLPTALAAVWMN